MIIGSGDFTYKVEEGWCKWPDGWDWGWTPGVACDSRDRVYVASRSEHQLVIFDREGNFIETWGEGILKNAHGIYIDDEDNVYCTEWEEHCVHKFNSSGELVMTLGTPGTPAPNDGDPFNKPTDLVVVPGGEIFVTDGYVNARVHKYSHDGELLFSWGDHGDGPGQFNLSHCIRIDRHERLWVCDLENRRIQIFDTNGKFLEERTGLDRPNMVFFDPVEEVVYVTELDYQVSIHTLNGDLITRWGGGKAGDGPGEFRGGPHGLWVDSRGDIYVAEVQVDGWLHKFVRQRS